MKFTKTSITAATVGLALTLAACSDDANNADNAAETTSSAASSAPAESEAVGVPTKEELNEVLRRAADSSLPQEERVNTVEGGEEFPELFDTMAAAQEESGAEFNVVDPVIPGYVTNSALATVAFTTPDGDVQSADEVEFIYQDGHWKLSRDWACVLITNTVEPEQVPATCSEGDVEVPPNEAEVIEEGHHEGHEGHDAPPAEAQ